MSLMNSPVISLTQQRSTTSLHTVAGMLTSALSASSSSIILAEGDEEVVKAEGLRHTEIRLDARHYKQPTFATKVLNCLRSLKVPTWTAADISADDVSIFKVSGSLTNAVFFVSSTRAGCRTVLLRIYGASSGSLISRPRELHTLHMLSSRYRFGPRVYGTFSNGRVEEYFESTTLTAADLRDPKISRWIGARMADLHSVDIEAIEGKGWEIAVKANIRSWIAPADDVLALAEFPAALRSELDFPRFKTEWDLYMSRLSSLENLPKGSRRVFAHNDTQYGNLLLLTEEKKIPDHRQLIVVDFEYAAPNPAAYDLANHWNEWMFNYHSDTPHLPDLSRYPVESERYNLYRAYLEHSAEELSECEISERLPCLDEQVQLWNAASHAWWAVWGIVQAREDVEGQIVEPEFEYLKYAQARMTAFRVALKTLGL
ncbi:unnamed protein product [Mycena citricolor]|uniref:Choline kinase n=1 Tax=Mycena citricolor TaxID=2018698 RepID=A0AAD2HQD9_9AGAR|nr:unnamed protein product [Mycena citricolor]